MDCIQPQHNAAQRRAAAGAADLASGRVSIFERAGNCTVLPSDAWPQHDASASRSVLCRWHGSAVVLTAAAAAHLGTLLVHEGCQQWAQHEESTQPKHTLLRLAVTRHWQQPCVICFAQALAAGTLPPAQGTVGVEVCQAAEAVIAVHKTPDQQQQRHQHQCVCNSSAAHRLGPKLR